MSNQYSLRTHDGVIYLLHASGEPTGMKWLESDKAKAEAELRRMNGSGGGLNTAEADFLARVQKSGHPVDDPDKGLPEAPIFDADDRPQTYGRSPAMDTLPLVRASDDTTQKILDACTRIREEHGKRALRTLLTAVEQFEKDLEHERD